MSGARIAALVLAAGRSRRMGGVNKLLAEAGGAPVVRHTVGAVLASRARPVIVVTGHDARPVRAALAGLEATTVHNRHFAAGLSTSLRAGLAALPPDADAALVCLADMPRVGGAVIDRLIAAYAPARRGAIVVPVHGGRRGNPTLWDRRFFEAMASTDGDRGARHLSAGRGDLVAEIPCDDAVLFDIDRPAALAAWRRRLRRQGVASGLERARAPGQGPRPAPEGARR